MKATTDELITSCDGLLDAHDKKMLRGVVVFDVLLKMLNQRRLASEILQELIVDNPDPRIVATLEHVRRAEKAGSL